MIRGLLFDLDGTLHDRQTTVTELAISQHSRFQQLSLKPLEIYLHRFLELDQRGYTQKEFVYESLAQEFDLGQSLVEPLVKDFYEQYGMHARGFGGLLETLSSLSDRGYRMAVVTNGQTAMQSSKIECLKIGHFFETIVISEQVGLKKPQPEIYKLVLDRFEIQADEAVFIGDNPKLDIEGPRSIGMKTIWFRDRFWGDCPYADATISHLSDLQSALALIESQ